MKYDKKLLRQGENSYLRFWFSRGIQVFLVSCVFLLFILQQCYAQIIPKTNWSLVFVDSQELVGENGAGVRAIDGNSTTRWHTKWLNGADPLPHEIQINLGSVYDVSGFRYLPRQDGGVNGGINQWEFYVGTSTANWGTPVATGTFANSVTEKGVLISWTMGEYIRLRTL